jgi:2-C-methyl-D-erythritol 4-phosphate cytidylyltransferase
VRNGLSALGAGGDDDIVVIHDAVRPFIGADLIRKSMDECLIHQAVAIGVPVKDTIKKVETDGFVAETMERKGLWLTQTPQTFRRGILLDGYRRADREAFYGTDDASLVERMGVRVRMLLGSYDNIKITTPEDLEYAEYLLSKKAKSKGK